MPRAICNMASKKLAPMDRTRRFRLRRIALRIAPDCLAFLRAWLSGSWPRRSTEVPPVSSARRADSSASLMAPRPVADFHFGPPLGEQHPREIAEPPLRTQRGTGLGEKAYAEVEGADDIGGASEDSRERWIAVCLFQKAPGA